MTETNPILAGIRQDLTDDTTYGQLAQRLVCTSLDLDAGKFDAESTPQDRRAAGVVLEYLCNVPISEAYNALQGSEPLIDLVDHYIPGGKFNSLDESLTYDLADNWSGDVQSTTGAYALVESHGDHIIVTEDELGFISIRFFDSAEEAAAHFATLEDLYSAWANIGGYSVHSADEDIVISLVADDGETLIQETVLAELTRLGL